MTPLAIIEALATVLWTYAALTFAAWALHVVRQDKGAHVAAVADLLGHLVPAMIGLVLTVLVGAFIGLPSVVALIALLFPAGLAYGVHTALSEARDSMGHITTRVAAAIGLATIIIAYRQVL